jgi:hypothetical protein
MMRATHLALLALAGCATAPTPMPYGNFAGSRAGFDEKMAADTVKQLTVLYPRRPRSSTCAKPHPMPLEPAW